MNPYGLVQNILKTQSDIMTRNSLMAPGNAAAFRFIDTVSKMPKMPHVQRQQQGPPLFPSQQPPTQQAPPSTAPASPTPSTAPTTTTAPLFPPGHPYASALNTAAATPGMTLRVPIGPDPINEEVMQQNMLYNEDVGKDVNMYRQSYNDMEKYVDEINRQYGEINAGLAGKRPWSSADAQRGIGSTPSNAYNRMGIKQEYATPEPPAIYDHNFKYNPLSNVPDREVAIGMAQTPARAGGGGRTVNPGTLRNVVYSNGTWQYNAQAGTQNAYQQSWTSGAAGDQSGHNVGTIDRIDEGFRGGQSGVSADSGYHTNNYTGDDLNLQEGFMAYMIEHEADKLPSDRKLYSFTDPDSGVYRYVFHRPDAAIDYGTGKMVKVRGWDSQANQYIVDRWNEFLRIGDNLSKFKAIGVPTDGNGDPVTTQDARDYNTNTILNNTLQSFSWMAPIGYSVRRVAEPEYIPPIADSDVRYMVPTVPILRGDGYKRIFDATNSSGRNFITQDGDKVHMLQWVLDHWQDYDADTDAGKIEAMENIFQPRMP